ncbi:hypothetical protein ACK2FW_19740 [Clostridioides difficile]
MSPKKMGRPVVGSPKVNDIKVRVDNETNEKLEEYCKKITLQRQRLYVRESIYCYKNKTKVAHTPTKVTMDYFIQEVILYEIFYHRVILLTMNLRRILYDE